METSTADVTVSVAVLETIPLSDAVMFDEPTATVVARPLAVTAATPELLEFHDTDAVMSCVGPAV